MINLAEAGGTNGHELWRDGPLAFMNDLDIVARMRLPQRGLSLRIQHAPLGDRAFLYCAGKKLLSRHQNPSNPGVRRGLRNLYSF